VSARSRQTRRRDVAATIPNGDRFSDVHQAYKETLLRGLGIVPVVRLTYDFNGVTYLEAEAAIRAAQDSQAKGASTHSAKGAKV